MSTAPSAGETSLAAPPTAVGSHGPARFGEYSPPAPAARARVDAVDLLRGIVMVVMLLDHTRDFAHGDAMRFDATDLSRTSVALFFTRWVTHFCAPVFVFLAGTGAYLQRARGTTAGELSRFLVTRGLWLIVLEFTVVRFGFTFNFDYSYFGALQVIWAIGVSMIVLAALVHLPTHVAAVFGVAMIALHNLLDGVMPTGWRVPQPPPDAWDKLWMVLHQPGPIPLSSGSASPVVYVLYPLVPWVGVMAAGYAFGAVYSMDAARRRRLLVRLGAALTVAFVVLRAANVYGDPSPWAPQRDATFTVLSFLKTTKYPPSLLFLLMTLGPALAFLGWAERRRLDGRLARPVVTLGRVPLFFYVLQWPTAHGLALVAGVLAVQRVDYQFLSPFDRPSPAPADVGFELPVVYLLWAIGLLLLYPLCRWFAGVKARRRDWWLGYL